MGLWMNYKGANRKDIIMKFISDRILTAEDVVYYYNEVVLEEDIILNGQKVRHYVFKDTSEVFIHYTKNIDKIVKKVKGVLPIRFHYKGRQI